MPPATATTFRKAFHPRAKLFWVKDGALSAEDVRRVRRRRERQAADDEARARSQVELIDITGDAAVAKLESIPGRDADRLSSF